MKLIDDGIFGKLDHFKIVLKRITKKLYFVSKKDYLFKQVSPSKFKIILCLKIAWYQRQCAIV